MPVELDVANLTLNITLLPPYQQNGSNMRNSLPKHLNYPDILVVPGD
jgi:hypothetical protein